MTRPKRSPDDGAAEGTLVWAETQTAGRGRRGRVWLSPPGNLYLSLVLRPDCAPAGAAQLGFVAALGLGDALRRAGAGRHGRAANGRTTCLANGRKLAGILLETEMIAGE